MEAEFDIDAVTGRINSLRALAEDIKMRSNGIQAVERNIDRILASIKMLEINVSDLNKLK